MKPRNARPSSRGFTLFELVAVIVIVSLVGAVFLNRLRFYQAMAERASLDYTLSVLKAGLQIKLAELIVTNRQADAVKLERVDPMLWLSEKPANYLGEYHESPARGNWYFDTRQRQLVYVVNNSDYFEAAEVGGVKQLRFKPKLVINQVNIYATTVTGVAGIKLVPVDVLH